MAKSGQTDSGIDSAGGGAAKVLYTLATANRIGLMNSAKALTAKNTCKACGLGMGGQAGGMTNELGEFPAVCNKSVQAQSTDIQAPIPAEIFTHSIEELGALSGHEMEHLGRLGNPVYKARDSTHFREISWEDAMQRAVSAFASTTPDRTFFYSSGRSSNEAGFLLQLLARLYGTNNVSNCSFYCHQATTEALDSTIGTGTATVELADLDGCDLFFLIGANPASNHPRLLHKLVNLRRRGGHIVVINPLREAGLVRFAVPKMVTSLVKGGDEVASLYVQPRAGTDVDLFMGIAKAVDEQGGIDGSFVSAHTNGFEAFLAAIRSTPWPDIVAACGVDEETIRQAAELYCGSAKTVFAWGMGMTHHLHGVQNIEWISNLALMRGMIGQRGAGMLPLRGHSNVQGIGTIGVKPVLPAAVFQKLEDELEIPLPTQPGMHTVASLVAAHEGKIDAAMMVGGNLFEATPNSRWAAEAMSRIATKVYLTTTLNRGHVRGTEGSEVIVLPVCARDEEPEATTQESMFNYVRLSDGGLRRIASVRAESHVLADLGSALLADLPFDFQVFKRHRRIREVIARVIPGMEDLEDIDVARREFHVRGRVLHRPEFRTADGRANFVVAPRPASESETGTFTLMSIRSEGQFNSIIYEQHDAYRGVGDRWTVLMNQQDVLELGLAEGGRVDITSSQGEMCNVRVKVFAVPRGNVAAYYPEANVLSSQATDPRSHTPAFKSVSVSIRRANREG